MAAASGVWSPYPTVNAQTASSTTQTDGTSSTSSNSSDNSATISANDFLTLLVTEMQNQDPTAATDPNEYINQLVNVNSLEQLISMNQNLQTALGQSSTTAATSASASGPSGQKASPQAADSAQQANSTNAAKPVASVAGAAANGARIVFGNLNAPESSAAASRVASALNGQR